MSKSPLNSYAKYSALGFQMAGIIFLCLFGGIKLDEFLELGNPIFTVVLTLAGLGFALYFMFSQILKK
ncbi:MAG TPA: AtpZ/AtpI family protein [Flavobacteriales bacterium]|nr:AtpZ/AtpI family protein [Flavobacteriales bacterium]